MNSIYINKAELSNIFITTKNNWSLLSQEKLIGFTKYELDGNLIIDEYHFFKCALKNLPQAESLKASSWDALSDAIQEGIIEQDSDVVFKWKNPEILAKQSTNLFIEAIETFLHAGYYLKRLHENDSKQRGFFLITILIVEPQYIPLFKGLLNTDSLKIWELDLEILND